MSTKIRDLTLPQLLVVAICFGLLLGTVARWATPLVAAAQTGAGLTKVEGSHRTSTLTTTGNSNADHESSAIDTTNVTNLCVQWVMTNGSTPVGKLMVRGRVSASNSWRALRLSAVHGAAFASETGVTFDPTSDPYRVDIASPGQSVDLILCVANVPAQIETFYDQTSGGTTSTISIREIRKGN